MKQWKYRAKALARLRVDALIQEDRNLVAQGLMNESESIETLDTLEELKKALRKRRCHTIRSQAVFHADRVYTDE